MRIFLSAATALMLILPTLAAAEPVRYQSDIKPIFDKHCVECHSGWFPDGGLRLNSLENIHEGGKQGRAVIAGQPEKGWLINLVRTKSGRYSKMPPGPAQLSEQEIQLIQQWIADGAR
ncbi:MAG: c-type cytochrome [Motiliproteus sp.]|nr:c-type cytochrome [Motiliproteus sp.]MCW9051425.1 c-type cytochrome [Motiliproteus sp.]